MKGQNAGLLNCQALLEALTAVARALPCCAQGDGSHAPPLTGLEAYAASRPTLAMSPCVSHHAHLPNRVTSYLLMTAVRIVSLLEASLDVEGSAAPRKCWLPADLPPSLGNDGTSLEDSPTEIRTTTTTKKP